VGASALLTGVGPVAAQRAGGGEAFAERHHRLPFLSHTYAGMQRCRQTYADTHMRMRTHTNTGRQTHTHTQTHTYTDTHIFTYAHTPHTARTHMHPHTRTCTRGYRENGLRLSILRTALVVNAARRQAACREPRGKLGTVVGSHPGCFFSVGLGPKASQPPNIELCPGAGPHRQVRPYEIACPKHAIPRLEVPGDQPAVEQVGAAIHGPRRGGLGGRQT